MEGARVKNSFLELFEFGRQLAVQKDTRKLFQLAVQGACRLAPTRSCALWVIKRVGSRLSFESFHCHANAPQPPPRAKYWIKRILKEGLPLCFSSAQATRNGLAEYLAEGATALLPLKCGENVTAVLVMGGAEIPAFSEEEMAWLNLIAGQVELGLWSGDLSDNLQRRKEQIGDAISNLGSALSLSNSPADFLRLAGDLVVNLAAADRAFVWQLKEAKLVLLCSVSCADSKPVKITRSSASSLARRSLRESAACGWREADSWPAGSALCIPLQGKVGPVGVITLYWKQPQAFDDAEKRILLSFAAQIAVALENLSLQQSDAKRLAQLADLSGAVSLMTACPDSPALMKTIVETIGASLNCPIVAIALAEDTHNLRLAAQGYQGIAEAQASKFNYQPLRGGKLERVLKRQETLTFSAGSDKEADDIAALLKAKSIACAPLPGNNAPLGLVMAAYPKAHTFHVAELTLLSAYANQASLALRNTLLCSDFTKHLDRLATFSEYARTLASSLDLDQTLMAVLQASTSLLETDYAYVALENEDSNQLEVRATKGFKDDNTAKLLQSTRLQDSLSGLAFKQDKVITSKDMRRDGRCKKREFARHIGMKSGLIAPLKARGKSLGVLGLFTKNERHFTEQEKRLIFMLADAAGIAVQNACLYQHEKRRSCDLSNLIREANHRIRSSLQVVSELLEMELDQADLTPAEVVRRSIDRIRCIGAVHGLLSREDFRNVEMKESARRIGEIALQSANRTQSQIQLHISGARIMLESRKATALSLALNEIISNALLHGLNSRKQGNICVSFTRSPREVLVVVRDDGVGLADDFDLARDSRMGLKIAAGIATQDLNGNISICSCQTGTSCQIRFPLS